MADEDADIGWPAMTGVEDAPLIYADGFHGIQEFSGVVRLNLFAIGGVPEGTFSRCTARVVMPTATFEEMIVLLYGAVQSARAARASGENTTNEG